MENDGSSSFFGLNKKSFLFLFCILTLLFSFHLNPDAFADEAGKKNSQKQEKINNLYHQAKVAYSKENFDQAEKLFNQVLEIDSKHSGAQTYLNNYIPKKRQQLKAAAEREKERQERIAKEKAERARQEKINNLYHQAKVAYSEDNLDQAKKLFNQVLRIDSKHSGAQTYLNNYIPKKRQQLKTAAEREKERQARIAKQEAE